jgi:hypothetical protein
MNAAIALSVWPGPVRWVTLPYVSNGSYTEENSLTATLSLRQRSHLNLAGRACLDNILFSGLYTIYAKVARSLPCVTVEMTRRSIRGIWMLL